jgi:hypothetical protein
VEAIVPHIWYSRIFPYLCIHIPHNNFDVMFSNSQV